MEKLNQSIKKVLQGALHAFKSYPAAIVNAIGFSIISFLRIYIGWSQLEPYNFLLNSLQLSFALGAFASLSLTTWERIKFEKKETFTLFNILGLAVSLIIFILLYFFGWELDYNSINKQLTEIAAVRVAVLIFLSILSFIYITGKSNEDMDFSKSLFMVIKANFLALAYGLVLMLGGSMVLAAIQGLLYRGLSSDYYSYLGVISVFLGFSVFLGYFPDFRADGDRRERERAVEQTKFVKILFQYIITPIMLSLTLVLVLWVGKTIIEGMKVSFYSLASVASSYAVGGILLHMLLGHHDTPLVRFYKKIYSYVGLFILIFQAWALLIQISKTGVKITEYFFIVLWISTLLSLLLLIFKREESYNYIALIAGLATIFVVLPYFGYHILPVRYQINRLEKNLVGQGLLVNNQLRPADHEIDKENRIAITDGVFFLISEDEKYYPDWLNKNFEDGEKFEQAFGFNHTFADYDDEYYYDEFTRTSIHMKDQAIDIEAYQWFINMTFGRQDTSLETEKGSYEFNWVERKFGPYPGLVILLDGEIKEEISMEEFIKNLEDKYPLGEVRELILDIDQMTYHHDKDDLEFKLIFSNIDYGKYSNKGETEYWLEPLGMYLREK